MKKWCEKQKSLYVLKTELTVFPRRSMRMQSKSATLKERKKLMIFTLLSPQFDILGGRLLRRLSSPTNYRNGIDPGLALSISRHPLRTA